jgi:putative transposase
MARFDPVDPRARLAIAQWPPAAPRGAVSTFCLEHAISAEDLLRDPATGAVAIMGGAVEPVVDVSPTRTLA